MKEYIERSVLLVAPKDFYVATSLSAKAISRTADTGDFFLVELPKINATSIQENGP